MDSYRLILVLIYTAKSLGINIITLSAPCSPRLTAIRIDDLPGHKFFPCVIDLHRCSGSYRGNSPNIFECVAEKTEDVIVKSYNPYNTATQKMETLILRGNDGNHTSCKPSCTIKPEQCPKPFTYNQDSCTCNCEHEVAPASYKCTAAKSWNKGTCSCQCRGKVMCSKVKGSTWNSELCRCACKPKLRNRCTLIGGMFNENTCSCTCKLCARKSSQDWNNNDNDKFIESRAFWIYTLIGEFIVMLLMFDLILFCKKSGMLYNCTRKRRTVEKNDNNSIEVIGDGEESCKTSFSSVQSINTYIEQEPLTSNKHHPINFV